MTWIKFGRRQLLGGLATAVGGLAALPQPASADPRPTSAERRRNVGPGVLPVPPGDSGRLATHLLLGAVRVYDSRAGLRFAPNGTDPVTGATDVPWVRGTERTIDIECVLGDTTLETGVPSTAAGVLMNITVANIKAGGYLVAWAPGEARPATANVNWSATTGVVNSLVMSRCVDGYVNLCTMIPSGAMVDVIIDVIGWLEPVA